MKERIMLSVVLAFACQISAFSQNNFQKEFDEFRKETLKEYDDFRKQCLQEYIDFLRQPWPKKESKEAIKTPKEKPVPPVVYTEPDTLPDYSKLKKLNGKEIGVTKDRKSVV